MMVSPGESSLAKRRSINFGLNSTNADNRHLVNYSGNQVTHLRSSGCLTEHFQSAIIKRQARSVDPSCAESKPRGRMHGGPYPGAWAYPSSVDFQKIPKPAGVYQAGAPHKAGDGVSFDGRYWIAKTNPNGARGEDFKGWRLAVRRGRDGRDYR